LTFGLSSISQDTSEKERNYGQDTTERDRIQKWWNLVATKDSKCLTVLDRMGKVGQRRDGESYQQAGSVSVQVLIG
jgi:hypothetical protein